MENADHYMDSTKQSLMRKEGNMIFFKSRCYNGGNQHKFRPRYNEKPNDSVGNLTGKATAGEYRDLLYYDEYLFDICEWCGEKIKKE